MLLFLTIGHRSIGLPYYPSAVVSSTNSLKTALFLIALTEETKRKNLDRLYFPLSLSMSNETLKELIDAGVDVNAQRGDGSCKFTIASWALYHCILPHPLENLNSEEFIQRRTKIHETASLLGVDQNLIDSLPKEYEAFKTEIVNLFPNLDRDTIDALHQVLNTKKLQDDFV